VDLELNQRKVPGLYDVTMLGYNYRLNEVQAAIGTHQVARLPGFLKKRRENYEALSRGLQEIKEITQFQSTQGDFQSSYYCLSILLNDQLTGKRQDIILDLKQAGVGTSIYYPRPVPHLTYYRDKYGHGKDTFPVAHRISSSSIALPVGPHMDLSDVEYVINAVKTAIQRNRS